MSRLVPIDRREDAKKRGADVGAATTAARPRPFAAPPSPTWTMKLRLPYLVVVCVLLAAGACGDDGGSGGDDAGGDDAGSDGGGPDAGPPPGCVPTGPQCNNCVDDDDDGQIDGADIECTGALDDDESSFATDIPGDNLDLVNQDCFFDGNSGGGDDGCNIHVCCILGAPDVASCPFGAQQYDPAECATPQSQACLDACDALTPPGCDCFGCCTVCDPATDQCFDIVTNPATAPTCDASNIADPNACPRCTKTAGCGTVCDPDQCILCPGQTEDDLPPGCTSTACPEGQEVCGGEIGCPTGEFCTNGCCIDGIP
jgi:hypothetical protein